MSGATTSSGLQDLAVRPATADEWDSAWARSPYATFFESRCFAELWSSYTRGECQPQAQRLSSGDRWTAVVPLTEQRAARGLASVYVLGPAGTYGGWLELGGHIDFAGAAMLCQWLISSHRSLVWRANPYDSVALHAFPKSAIIDFTQAIPLGREASSVLKGWSPSHAGAVREADGLGVTVRRASSLADWRSYYELYERSLTRWGSAANVQYDWRLFELLADMPLDHVQLWIASAAGTDLSGIVCVLHKNRVVAWSCARVERGIRLPSRAEDGSPADSRSNRPRRQMGRFVSQQRTQRCR